MDMNDSKQSAIDFLKSDVTFAGRDVYIIGSGPNGPEHYNRIPSPSEVEFIAVNKAIKIAPLTAYWLCSAPNLVYTDYFHIVMHEHLDTGVYTPILSARLTQNYPETPYYIIIGPPLGHGDYNIVSGCVRRGAGSVGVALQTALQKQAARCVLVGVDMEGKGYFDGTANVGKRSIHPDGTWTQLPGLQHVVDNCKSNGMDVVSMSKTKLKVEMV